MLVDLTNLNNIVFKSVLLIYLAHSRLWHISLIRYMNLKSDKTGVTITYWHYIHSTYTIDRRWCHRETPWKDTELFTASEGLSKSSFTWKKTPHKLWKTPRCLSKGSFPVFSIDGPQCTYLKFSFSEKATKICAICLMVLTST